MPYGTVKADSVINSSGTTVDLTAITTDNATTSAAGYMSAADKTKLDGIEAGAEVNVVTSVNTATGAVVLDADDIDDTSTTHKFATAAQLSAADSALQSADNISELTNDSGYITGYTVTEADVTTHQAALSVTESQISDLGTYAVVTAGKISSSVLPDIAITEYLGSVADQTAMLALTGEEGDWCTRSDDGKVYVITGSDPSVIGGWTALTYPVAAGTDLTYTASTRALESSTGSDVTLPEVVAAGDSGLMTGADKTKLDGIAAGAEVNVAYDDDVALQLGTGNDTSFVFDGTDTDIRLTGGDLKVEDGTTLRFTFARTTGDFTATGNVTAYSDINLKENVEVIPDALEKVAAIRGVTYDRKDIEGPRHAGVIAQEVEAVLPEVVMTDAEGTKSVAYGNLAGLLIEAVKELKAEVETLKQERN